MSNALKSPHHHCDGPAAEGGNCFAPFETDDPRGNLVMEESSAVRYAGSGSAARASFCRVVSITAAVKRGGSTSEPCGRRAKARRRPCQLYWPLDRLCAHPAP